MTLAHRVCFRFSRNAGADKIRRYINYLFHQKSFYPLFPPKVPTDLRLLHEYGTINKIPNILVVPSDMKYYMRVSLSQRSALFTFDLFSFSFEGHKRLLVRQPWSSGQRERGGNRGANHHPTTQRSWKRHQRLDLGTNSLHLILHGILLT